ncbi:MAG TPA: ABC transporter ATP-binding protein, partial [Clostridiales bacterium]|nr:ABC transporter ATP-binding protein [Clostridiales bacterium]
MIKKSEIITIEASGLEDKDIEVIRELRNVYGVTYENNTLKVEAGSGKHNVIDIVNILQDRGYKMKKIFSEQPTLNDVFLELTGKQLRDE